MATTNTPSAGTLIVSQSATPFLEFLRTATTEDIKDACRESAARDIDTQDGEDDLTNKFHIVNGLRLFRFDNGPCDVSDLVYVRAVSSIQSLLNREHQQAGLTTTCTADEASQIAQDIFHSDAAPEAVHNQKDGGNIAESTGQGLGAKFRRLLTTSRRSGGEGA